MADVNVVSYTSDAPNKEVKQVTPTQGLPVTVVGGAAGTDTSIQVRAPFAASLTAPAATTITTGGASQQLFAANANRKGWYIQNQSDDDLYVRRTSAATADQSSLRIPPGALYEAPVVTGEALNIIGATTDQAFHAREW